MNVFKGRHFQRDIILWAVRWYCKYGISYRELQEMLAERGMNVDHTTLYRWVQRYAPEMERRLRWYWLADFLNLNAANDKEIVADYGLGRNCTLFDKTRKWAYRAIRQGWPEYDQWLQACYERASAYNLQFAAPLDENEVNGIAKSIAKWTVSNFSEESFRRYTSDTHTTDIQKMRGRLGGLAKGINNSEKRVKALKLHQQGKSQQSIANILMVSQKTISNWLRGL